MQYHSVEVEFVDSFSVGIAVVSQLSRILVLVVFSRNKISFSAIALEQTSHDNNVLATLDVSHLEISDVVYSLPLVLLKLEILVIP